VVVIVLGDVMLRLYGRLSGVDHLVLYTLIVNTYIELPFDICFFAFRKEISLSKASCWTHGQIIVSDADSSSAVSGTLVQFCWSEIHLAHRIQTRWHFL